jgi:hypothetical protein
MASGLPCCCTRLSGPGATTQQLTDLHLLNCQSNGLLTLRHNALASVFAQMCAAVKLNPTMEPLAGSHHNRRFRYDISIERADGWGRDVKLDISVRNPLAKKLLPQSSKHRLYAAELGADQKRKHYNTFVHANSDLKFIPIIVESFGAMHLEVRNFIASLAERANNLPPDSATFAAPTFAAYWTQRIAVCLQRENAKLTRAIILRTKAQLFASSDDCEESDANMEDLPSGVDLPAQDISDNLVTSLAED